MSVESPGFVAIRRTIAIPELGEPEEDLLIYLQPGGVVEGVVRNEHYEPVTDARILVREFPDLSTISRYRLAQTTGADGTFRVDTLSALHRKLVVEHNDFARTSIDIAPTPDRPTRVEITLTKGGSVEGLVTVHGLIPARSPYGFGETGSIQVDYPEQPSLAYVHSQVPADGTIGLAGLPPG